MITELPQSSIGKKVIMAVTGLMLIGFVIGHLAGNLLIFLGPDALNAYAQKLRDLGGLLWVARFVLLGAVLAHIVVAVQLTIENRKARPIPYSRPNSIQTSYAARTMAMSGIIVLAFIVYHLLHFTFRVTHSELSHLVDAMGRHDVYTMVVASFQQPLVSISYVIALALLCFHLSHGFSSMFQSLGLNDSKYHNLFKWTSRGLALAIFLGYSLIPISSLTGCLKLPGASA